ncbi:MAG TPA: ATP-binding protein [Polyangiaceae bacterium]|nr:ATP-binding protein [Polyangiaceae bacterium]
MSEYESSRVPLDHHLQALTLGNDVRLQDLVDHDALRDMVRSFHTLFGISLRIFSSDGLLLAESVTGQEICHYIGTLENGLRTCMATVSKARTIEPAARTKEVTHPCFTGAQYQIFSIDYDNRKLGKAVLGPFLPAEMTSVPDALLAVDPKIDRARVLELLPRMPRAKAEAITLICEHLRRTLDLILWSGHKSLLTSQMHLSSVRESYRELQQKNEKLQEAFDRLRELDRLKSNFLGVVSHELRTPLTSIIGYSEMLVEGIAGPLVGDQLKFVQTINDKGQQLLQLIMSLLDLSKLESGTMSMKKGTVTIAQLLSDVAATLAPKARKRSIEIECTTEPGLPDVQGDPERLRQVFVNLLDNAVKFSSEGSTIRVTAGTKALDDSSDEEGFSLLEPSRRMIEITVIDTGIGIPEDERERIFDAFYQVDSSSTREHEGTGLGLSIVKRLVDAHGGSVRVSANLPTGAVFAVVLPAANPRNQLASPRRPG